MTTIAYDTTPKEAGTCRPRPPRGGGGYDSTWTLTRHGGLPARGFDGSGNNGKIIFKLPSLRSTHYRTEREHGSDGVLPCPKGSLLDLERPSTNDLDDPSDILEPSEPTLLWSSILLATGVRVSRGGFDDNVQRGSLFGR